jgi:hypothetical protein
MNKAIHLFQMLFFDSKHNSSLTDSRVSTKLTNKLSINAFHTPDISIEVENRAFPLFRAVTLTHEIFYMYTGLWKGAKHYMSHTQTNACLV